MKTFSYWAYWLFLYGIACLPAALFGSTLAAAFYGFHMIHKPHTGNYFQGMYLWEMVGAGVSATPGFVWVLWSQSQGQRKEQEKLQARRQADAQDETVWPPAPLE